MMRLGSCCGARCVSFGVEHSVAAEQIARWQGHQRMPRTKPKRMAKKAKMVKTAKTKRNVPKGAGAKARAAGENLDRLQP